MPWEAIEAWMRSNELYLAAFIAGWLSPSGCRLMVRIIQGWLARHRRFVWHGAPGAPPVVASDYHSSPDTQKITARGRG